MTAIWTPRNSDHAMSMMKRFATQKELDLTGKTLGLIGVDDAALTFTKRAQRDCAMSVIAFSPELARAQDLKAAGVMLCNSLSELLATSDVISLHCQPLPGRAVIGGLELGRMREDALLISATTPDLIDQIALAHALWFETIGGACLAASTVIHELAGCDDLIVAPVLPEPIHAHIALCA